MPKPFKHDNFSSNGANYASVVLVNKVPLYKTWTMFVLKSLDAPNLEIFEIETLMKYPWKTHFCPLEVFFSMPFASKS